MYIELFEAVQLLYAACGLSEPPPCRELELVTGLLEDAAYVDALTEMLLAAEDAAYVSLASAVVPAFVPTVVYSVKVVVPDKERPIFDVATPAALDAGAVSLACFLRLVNTYVRGASVLLDCVIGDASPAVICVLL